MSLTKATYSMIEGASANVLDYGAVADGTTDDTAAFTAAMAANKNVWVPAGTYALNGLRITNGVNLIGAGKNATFFNQYSAATPAIDCTSDVTVGQLAGVRLANFAVNGHASASVAAVKIYATGIYAIWRSEFDFAAFNTYRAADIEGPSANNVFNCSFKIISEGSSDYAVYLNGGVFNTFDLFLTQCETYAVYGSEGFNNTFIRLVTDGCISMSGQNTIVMNLTVEEMHAATPPSNTVISLTGFNQVFITPTVIMNAANAAKFTYCMKPFSGTLIQNSNFIFVGATKIPNPFATNAYSWTVVGPVRSQCTNKMETIYDGTDTSKSIQNVGFVGDVSAITDTVTIRSGKTPQYLAPSAPFNFNVNSNTGAVIWEPTGVIALANVNLDSVAIPPVNGRTISFYTTQTITTLNLLSPSGANVSLLPTTLAGGGKLTVIYDAAQNKYYPI